MTSSLANPTRSLAALLVAATTFLSVPQTPVHASGLSAARPLNSYGAADNAANEDFDPKVASDGNGRMVSVWKHATTAQRFNPVLQSSGSVTSGTSWAAPSDVPLPEGGYVAFADVCYAGNDHWVAIYRTSGFNSRIMTAVSDDVGLTWSTPNVMPQIEEPFHTESRVKIESDGEGNMLAIWTQRMTATDPPLNHVVFARSTDYGITWSIPAVLAQVPPDLGINNISVEIAYVGGGKWTMIYPERIVSPEPQMLYRYMVAESSDAGDTWNVVGPLFTDLYDASFDIAAAAGKTVVSVLGPLVLYDVEGEEHPHISKSGLAVFVSNDAGTSFTGPQRIEPAALSNPFARDIDLAADAAGNWMLAAYDQLYVETLPVRIYQTTDLSTTWTLSREIHTDPNVSFDLAAAGMGNFALVADDRIVPAESIHTDTDIVAYTTTDVGQTWDSKVDVSSAAGSDMPTVVDFDVDIAAGDSVVLASWTAYAAYYPHLTGNPSYVKQVMIATSLNNGVTWGPAAPLPGAFSGQFGTMGAGTRTQARYLGGQTFEVYWLSANDAYMKAVSTDAGLTWSAPTTATAPDPVDSSVVAGQNADQIRVRTELVGSAPYTLNTYAEISADSGATWGEGTLIHTQSWGGFRYRNLHRGEPAIIHLGDGRLAVLIKNIWMGRNDVLDVDRLYRLNMYLVESADNGRTWTEPQTVADTFRATGPRGPGDYQTPLRASGDRIIVAWPDGDSVSMPSTGNEGDILYRTKVFGRTTAAGDWQLFE